MLTPRIIYTKPLTLFNAGFELGNQGWGLEGGWDIVNNPTYYSPGGSGHWAAYRSSPGGGNGNSNIGSKTHIPCTPGQVLTVTAWMFKNDASSTGGTGYVRIQYYNAANAVIGTNNGNTVPSTAGGWTLSTATGTAPNGTIKAYVDFVVNGATTGAILVNDVILTGATTPVTLDFVTPPTQKPAFQVAGVRNDTFSTGGVRQSVFQRAPSILPIVVQAIYDDNQDLPAWQAFLTEAVKGTSFEYYPDSTNPTNHDTYFLVDTSPKLTYNSPGTYSFTGTFQKEVKAQ